MCLKLREKKEREVEKGEDRECEKKRETGQDIANKKIYIYIILFLLQNYKKPLETFIN